MLFVCRNCGKTYSIDDPNILKGCECGHTSFKIIRQKDKSESPVLDVKNKDVQKKIMDMQQKLAQIETIRSVRPGVYEIDIDALLMGAPIIVSRRTGVYSIAVSTEFAQAKKRARQK